MMRSACLVAMVLVPALCISQNYFDYADVIDVKPIHSSKRIPVRAEVCEAPRASVPPGDAGHDRSGATIGELVRADDRRRRPVCRAITRYETRDEVTGWRVRYRYAGRTYTRRMAQDPGKRIRVRVDLDPGGH